jgi:N-acetylglucosamine kinase-like BadF-type ATPase
MLAPEQFFTWDAWENKAIARLVPALDEAVSSGRPIAVERFTTSLSDREVVTLAIDLCRRAEANVAVLAGSTQKVLTFVPLFTTLFVPPKSRTAPTREEIYAQVGLVGAGAAREVFI